MPSLQIRHPKFQPYRARDGWRWRLKAANGRILADSGQAYTTRWNCLRAIDTIRFSVLVRDLAA